MNKIKLILDLHGKEFIWEKPSLVSALIATLTAGEACSLFNLEHSYDLRRATLRRIASDMALEFCDVHKSLVSRLVTSYDLLSYKHKKGCIHALGYLHPYMPENVGLDVIQFLLSSNYVSARRKAYKLIQSDWRPDYIDILKGAWEQHKDKECARLMVNEFPIAFIQENIDKLEEVLLRAGMHHTSRLYIRIGVSDLERFERLRNIDEITYTYVCAKLGKNLSDNDALEIFEKNRMDDRVGLLIWSFGRLGLWDVLESIASRVHEFQLERFEVLKKDLTA